MICALAFVTLIAIVDFNVAFWGAALRLWDEATGNTGLQPCSYEVTSAPQEPVAVPEMYRRQEGAVRA